MPLPKPEQNEREDDFISRCVSDPQVIADFDTIEQRFAVCVDIWDGQDVQTSERS